MAVGTWTLFPFATSVFLAAMLHCKSHSDEHYQEPFPNGLFCSSICEDDDMLKGETFHCVLSNEGNDYTFIARNPKEDKWRFYRTDLDPDSSLLCQIGENGDKFAADRSRRKCPTLRNSRDTYDSDSDLIPKIMKGLLRNPSKNSGQFGDSVPLSRKSNMAVSASGPGSFAQASDGTENLFVSGDKKPSAKTSGNAHAFSTDGITNAESHFGNDFIFSPPGRPTGGRPIEESAPSPFFNLFKMQQPSFPVFGGALAPNMPGLSQNMPGLAQNMPGLSQNMPGLPQTMPGLAQNRPGVAPNMPGLAAPSFPQPSPGQMAPPFSDVFSSVGLPNPFLMLSGQYNGQRNLRHGQNPRLYQQSSDDSLFPSEYAVAFLPYMNPYMSLHEAPRRYRKCYPRCKREVIDSSPEDDDSEENFPALDSELLDEICSKIEAEICRKKKIAYCNENESCCWEKVDVNKCDDGQVELSIKCYMRLSAILGLK